MTLFTIDDLNEMQEEAFRILGAGRSSAQPKKSTIDTILGYNRSLSVKDTHSLGKIFMNIN